MNRTHDQYDRSAAILVPKYAQRTNAANEQHRYAIRWPTHIKHSVSAPTPEALIDALAARLRKMGQERKLMAIHLPQAA